MQIIGAIKTTTGMNYVGYSDGEVYFLNPVNDTWVVLDMQYTNPENIDLTEEQVTALCSNCPGFMFLNKMPYIIKDIEDFVIVMTNGSNDIEMDLNEVVSPESEDAVQELMRVGA